MPLVNYEGDSSDEEEDNNTQPTINLKPSASRRIHLPTPSQTSSKITIEDDDDEFAIETNTKSSSNLLANLPKPQDSSSSNVNINSTELIEGELEDIVRGNNKEYAKNIPSLPKPTKRRRDGPVKIFIPTIEHDSDEEQKPKRKQITSTRNCALLNSLPPPVYDEDMPTTSLPTVKNPSTATTKTPQISSTGLFIPYTINKKKQQQQKKSSTAISTSANGSDNEKDEEDDDDDDDDNQADFLGLTKSNQIEVTNTDVESVLRETFPKARSTVIEQPSLPNPPVDFDDLDTNDDGNNQQIMQDDDELLQFLPKNERYKEIKHVHIDAMLGDSAKIQLLKNRTAERETMLAQAAIHVPKGETRKRAQITYLIAKAQHDDLQLKNMWSEQKLTKRQTQAKYGF